MVCHFAVAEPLISGDYLIGLLIQDFDGALPESTRL
jgi:hypothetical protein